MAQGQDSHHPHDTLDDINSLADRLRDWIAANPVPILAAAALLLASAAGYGGWSAWRSRSEDRASAAYSTVEREYLKAMGASPGATEIVEPANPDTAKTLRREYSEKFLAVAADHQASRAAWAARLSAGDLLLAAGDSSRAIEIWQEAVQRLPSGDTSRGIALQRIAAAREAAGSWKESAEAWLEAANLPGYPLRTWSLAQAARCFREAGETQRAIDIAKQVGPLPGDASLPAHLQGIVAELTAQGGGAPPAAVTPSAP